MRETTNPESIKTVPQNSNRVYLLRLTGRILIVTSLLLAAGLLVTGCMQPATPATTVPAGQPPAPVSSDLQKIVENGLVASGIPGAQVEIVTPDWTWTSAAGNASVITGEKAVPGMKFYIASVSKSFTGVAVEKLVQDGKLSLNDPITKWLDPDLVARIPHGQNITVKELLQHTSGIADYDEMGILGQELKNPSVAVPYEEGINISLNASPLYPPEGGYTYSNVNYVLLTLIVDKAAGMPFEDYVNQTIFVPSGMNETYFAKTNQLGGSHMTAAEEPEPGTIEDYSNLYILFDRGAGDIVSTTSDLNKFHKTLRSGKILNQASLAELEKPSPQSRKTVNGTTSGYGLGYGTYDVAPDNQTYSGHTGGYPGSATFWYYLLKQDTYVTINVNSVMKAKGANQDIVLPVLRYLRDMNSGTVSQATYASSVTMIVSFPPVPVQSTNVTNLAYELEITPPANTTIVPEKVEVLDAATGTVLYSAESDTLTGIYHAATNPPPTASELMNGTAKLRMPRISLWFTVSPTAVPDRLIHRVTLNQSAQGQPILVVTGGEVTVLKNESPVIIGSPMKGDGWMAMETTAPNTHHFGAQITIGNVTRVPQRFAQDWVYVNPKTGNVAAGNASLAKNYLGFGKKLYAVADGTVVDAKDWLPDNEIIYQVPPASLETAAGNYAIIDIGNNKYACYAHMVNSSVKVKAGDKVKEGEVIGLMGNSGNSDLPHLHFQIVTDDPTFLASEGYPHAYRFFNVTGRINTTAAIEDQALHGITMEELWGGFAKYVIFNKTPVPEQVKLPENWEIVEFP